VPSIQIAVAEDEQRLCERLREQLECLPDLEITSGARNGREVITTAGRLVPDILILDIDLPGMCGLELLQVVRWCSPDTKVIVLSNHTEEAIIREAIEIGAKGYLVKGDGADMAKVIRAVQRGEVWTRRRILAEVLNQLISLAGLDVQAIEDKPAPA
jgi:DNA-binding NarL/FixJ family response regulator